jgi:hypothetical protein
MFEKKRIKELLAPSIASPPRHPPPPYWGGGGGGVKWKNYQFQIFEKIITKET